MDESSVDLGMYKKGYRYKLVATTIDIDDTLPLVAHCKTLKDVTHFINYCSGMKFYTVHLKKCISNPYAWLNDNMNTFLSLLKIEGVNSESLIILHSDKCKDYKAFWNEQNIPFAHGIAIYLLMYIPIFSKEIQNTTIGWMSPYMWVIDNYPKFKPFLPPITE